MGDQDSGAGGSTGKHAEDSSGVGGCLSKTMKTCAPKAGFGSWSENQPWLLEACFSDWETL